MKPTDEPKHQTHWFLYVNVFVVSLLSFGGMMLASWPSPVLAKLLGEDNPLGYNISTDQASWITSVSSLGSLCGPVPFGFMANRFGRKPSLVIVGMLLSGSYLILAFAKELWLYYLARFVGGFGVGGGLSLTGVYISELAYHEERSMANTLAIAVLALGVLTPYLIGPHLNVMVFNLICAIAPTVFCLIFILWMEETPPYLLTKGQVDKAHESLKKHRKKSPEQIEKELADMQAFVEEHHTSGTIVDIVKSKVLMKSMGIAFLLNTILHTSGVTVMIAYTQEIFEAAGTGISSDLSAIIVSSIQFVLSFGVPIVIRRFKFRHLLLSGCVCIVISLSLLGLFFFLNHRTDVDTGPISWLPILTMVTCLLGYVYGLGAVTTIIMVELFPTHTRSLANSVINMIGSLEGFLINRYFFPLASVIGMEWCFWFFAVGTAMSAVIIYLVVPETNGKTFQEVQDILRK